MADLGKFKEPRNAIKLLELFIAIVNICIAYAPKCDPVLGRAPPVIHFVIIGYFFIICVQILSRVIDENESPIITTMTPLSGAIFHLTAGSLMVNFWRDVWADIECGVNGITP